MKYIAHSVLLTSTVVAIILIAVISTHAYNDQNVFTISGDTKHSTKPFIKVPPNIDNWLLTGQDEPFDLVAQPVVQWLNDGSLLPIEGDAPYPFPIIYYGNQVAYEIDVPDAPAINVWYGSTQNFGQIGNPQRWVNILGNVRGATSLSYSLNGGPLKDVTIGSDDFSSPYHLSDPGDFNIELHISDLNDGANDVMIHASDGVSYTTQYVTVNYNPNSVWPLPATVDWSNYGSVFQAAQPVDGLWTINGGQLETVVPGYDRFIAIGQGNMTGNGWKDYEVKVPVTVHSLNGPGSGVGIIVRWSGQYATDSDPAGGPTSGWRQIGALAWYRWASTTKGAFEILGNGGQGIVSPQTDKAIQLGVPYIFKLSVQSASLPGNTATYRFKIWKASEPEPKQWYMTASGAEGEPAAGSAVLVAHNAMVSFGDVDIKSTATSTPTPTPTVTPSATITPTPTATRPATVARNVFLPAIANAPNASPPCWPGPIEVEPNNTATAANGPLCHGATIRGLPNDRWDMYYLETTRAGDITATLTNYFGGGMQLQLYYGTPGGSPSYMDTEGGDGLQAALRGAPPGRYYIAIYTETPNPAETRPYKLQLITSLMSCFAGPNEKKPNNDAAQANVNGPLCHGATISGLPEDKFDYFMLDTTRPGRVAAIISNHFGEGVQLALYLGGCCSESQRVDFDSGQADGLEVAYTASQPGRFYIVIYSETPKPNETRPYALQVEFP